MINLSKKLENELEATTRGLQQQVSKLQRNVNKLNEMVNSSDATGDQYQFGVWTEGEAARCCAEIASLLSRARTLQEAIRLMNEEQESR